jgi:hypothetical protein
VVAPGILHVGRWQGHEVLAQEALPAWRRRRPAGYRLPVAMRQVAAAFGMTTGPLAESTYRTGLRARLSTVDDYPGDDEVDWTRVDAYAGKTLRPLGDLLRPFLTWAAAVSYFDSDPDGNGPEQQFQLGDAPGTVGIRRSGPDPLVQSPRTLT